MGKTTFNAGLQAEAFGDSDVLQQGTLRSLTQPGHNVIEVSDPRHFVKEAESGDACSPGDTRRLLHRAGTGILVQSINELPVIGPGLSRPSSASSVGAMSASRPP